MCIRDSFQPKGGKVYTTQSRRTNSDKSDSRGKNKRFSPNRGKSFTGPRGPGNYPGNFLKIMPVPRAECVFCGQLHHPHLCLVMNTLELCKTYLQKAILCFTCLQRHKGNVTHAGKVEHCRWFGCMATDHHSALCPTARYPIKPEDEAQWKADLVRVKAEIRAQ